MQTRLNMQEQAKARLGQGNTAIDTIKQANTQALLQPFELLADGWLGSAQFLCRSGKTAMSGCRLKSAQQVEGHVTQSFIH